MRWLVDYETLTIESGILWTIDLTPLEVEASNYNEARKLGMEAVKRGTYKPEFDGILPLDPTEDEPDNMILREQAIRVAKSIMAAPNFKPEIELVTPL
jgi:hypothetical protein